jgi:hypothetical protein
MYHFATGHDAWKSRQSVRETGITGSKPGSSTPKSTPAATLAVASCDLDSDDDDTGWTPVRI